MNSSDIKRRAVELSEKTNSETISPQEVGGIMYDTVSYMEDVQRNSGSLGIRKTYTSVSAMEADTNPKDSEGNPLKKGMLVNIYNPANASDPDNNKVYAYNAPGWVQTSKLDAGYATKAEINELNISNLYPTNGEGGTNKYTLESAIAQVPAEYRIAGVKVTFINESNDTESWEYKGNGWTVSSFRAVGALKLSKLDEQQYKTVGTKVNFTIALKDKFLYNNYAIGAKAGMSLGFINVEGVESLFLLNTVDGSNISEYKYIDFLFYSSTTPNNDYVIKSQGEHIYNAGESSKNYASLKVPQSAKILAISSDFSGNAGDVITKEGVYAICINKDVNSISTLQNRIIENEKNISENANKIIHLENTIKTIQDYKVSNWDWESNIDENVAAGAGNCIFGIPIEEESFLSIKFYQALQGDIKLLICDWDKPDGTINIEEQIPISVNVGINEIITDKKISAGKYIGLSRYYYNKNQRELGESYIVSNKYAFKGEMLSYTILSETSEKLLTIDKELKENIEKTDENKKSIDENAKKIISLEEKIAGITGNEFWIKSYGNTFNQADYVVYNAEVNESSIILNQAGGYAALNKKYWSDRRIHRFVVTSTSLGVLKINMAQNTSNLMFSDMTAAGNWTSEFRIDMSNNKIYIGQQEFDSSITFIQGRKYIVELKYIRRIFYVTITDFLTREKTECVLDTSVSNQNGAFKCFLTFENISGSYTIEQVETYLVSGVLLILFGDSVTESCGRVGKGENFSEIIAEKYGSVTIVAQGGAGQGSWSEIFENEIKYIQPKYCSWHMGLNGGFSKEQVEQVILDCQNINAIPIINHVISYIVTGREETSLSPALNTIVDEIWAGKGYRGYYGDIATAKNNDINDRTNYSAANSKTVPGGFDIIKTSASYDAFFTYTIAVGKTVVENGEQRVLDAPLEVIMNIHPKAEGHKLMAERYFLDVKL